MEEPMARTYFVASNVFPSNGIDCSAESSYYFKKATRIIGNRCLPACPVQIYTKYLPPQGPM
jgi:hypothetical protein